MRQTYDFIVTGTSIPDTTAPLIQTVTTLNEQQINLEFTEWLDPLAAQNTRNFSLANLGRPESAVLLVDQKTIQIHRNVMFAIF